MPAQDGTGSPLFFLVGGASSGKSLVAERQACSLAARRLYVATMQVCDAETEARVARHRARRGEGWQTVEAGRDLAASLWAAPEAGVVLVDSLGVWLSGLLCGVHDGRPAPEGEILALVEDFAQALGRMRRPVLLVSDEAGLGLVPMDAGARLFRDLLGRMNQRLAAVADNVFFVSCGLPLRLKGEATLA